MQCFDYVHDGAAVQFCESFHVFTLFEMSRPKAGSHRFGRVR
ncbi:hypothetical protein PCAR4_150216 [Paraburkholderia caribensis]|nr:hypothetical protein PCAR4_150216 [Paraburkholderia caribensis]